MNFQNAIATMVTGSRVSITSNRNRRGMIVQWLKRLLIVLFLISGPVLTANPDPPPPPANYILAPTNGAVFGLGQVVNFIKYSDGVATSQWSFGDGTSSTNTSATHAYSVPGNYTVTLYYPQVGSSRDGTPAHSYTISVTVLPRPTITAFSASFASINRGDSTTLNWSATGGGLAYNLNQGIGAVSGNSRLVAPAATTTYVLTATNLSGSVTSPCTVTVNQPPVIGAPDQTFDAGKAVSLVLPATATDPENQALTYTATGLPAGLTFDSSTRTLSGVVAMPGIYPFTYTATDPKGAKASTTATLTVQAAGLIPATGTTTLIKYDYDDQGRLLTLTYPSGRAAGYAYDELDRVTAVSYNGQAVVQPIIYDDWGNPVSRQFKSGARDEWEYKDASHARVTRWSIGPVGGTPQARVYGYDAADRLTQAGEWETLGYDVNSRLIKAKSTAFGIDNDLDHDAFNNNIKSVSTGALPSPMIKFEFNPMTTNHIPGGTKSGATVLINETNWGEITQLGNAVGSTVGTFTMTWDDLGRMTSTTYGTSGGAESFRYTASGLRIIRTDNLDANRNRYYAYANDGHMLTKYEFPSGANPALSWSADILYLGNEAIAQVDGAGAHALHNDHQGTPRVITSPAGTIEGTQAFGPYGEQIQHSGYSPVIGYTGHILTEPTGLIYMRGRFYSPAWHRFMNSDGGIDPNDLNQFDYCGENPFMSTDPTGMVGFWASFGEAAISAPVNMYREVAYALSHPIETSEAMQQASLSSRLESAVSMAPGVGGAIDGVKAAVAAANGDTDAAGTILGNSMGRQATEATAALATEGAIKGVQALRNIASEAEAAAPALHGNNLNTTKPAIGYTLRDSETGEVLKYGETTRGPKRYSQKYLKEKNAYMQFETEGTKREMHKWQHDKILEYKDDNSGARPPLNKSDW